MLSAVVDAASRRPRRRAGARRGRRGPDRQQAALHRRLRVRAPARGDGLAAEFRWALLPPLTLWSPRVRIAGMLEPAYEIAGDAFDYAVNGDIAHVAMFDTVGHGMRACRIANLAIAMYRNCSPARCRPDRDRRSDRRDPHRPVRRELVRDRDARRARHRARPAAIRVGGPSAAAAVARRQGRRADRDEAGDAAGTGRSGARGERMSARTRRHVLHLLRRRHRGSERGRRLLRRRAAGRLLGTAAADELSPAETVRRLIIRLYEHSPAPLHDDATMLLVNWRKPDDSDAD